MFWIYAGGFQKDEILNIRPKCGLNNIEFYREVVGNEICRVSAIGINTANLCCGEKYLVNFFGLEKTLTAWLSVKSSSLRVRVMISQGVGDRRLTIAEPTMPLCPATKIRGSVMALP